MPDRVVYLVESLPKKPSEELELVTDVELAALLAAGWETGTTLPDRKITVAGKKISAVMMVLKLAADNRGVSVRSPADDLGGGGRGGRGVIIQDEFGASREVSLGQAMINGLTRALANVGDPGHLGAARNHNMPGLSIISGEMIQKALDMGGLAARAGHSIDSCPFPAGSEAQQRWLRGYRMIQQAGPQKVSEDAANDARDRGRHDAQAFGPDDVVSCPFPPGSPLRDYWIEGFKEKGGRVE